MNHPWTGAAAVCVNREGQVLMVLQGKPEEEKTWSVPSGGKEPGETYEECCLREVKEETGYNVKIMNPMFIKNNQVHYFRVEIVGGSPCIQDPDQLIYDIAWMSRDELKVLRLTYAEDRQMLIQVLEKYAEQQER